MSARVCVAFGTRPEASKLAPVIHALRKQTGLEPLLLVTGQHREQLAGMLELFGLTPDVNLDVMKTGQNLPELFARTLPQAAAALREPARGLCTRPRRYAVDVCGGAGGVF